jgi:hypothetical protein
LKEPAALLSRRSAFHFDVNASEVFEVILSYHTVIMYVSAVSVICNGLYIFLFIRYIFYVYSISAFVMLLMFLLMFWFILLCCVWLF